MAARGLIRKLLQGKAPRLQSAAPKRHQETAGSGGLNPLTALAVVGAGASASLLSFAAVASAASDEAGAGRGLACPRYPWPHDGILSSIDPSIQRGQKVFQHDCAACHSMLPHRNFKEATHAEDEAKTMAAEILLVDEHEDVDEQLHANEPPAGFLNGNACAPDLSLITKILDGLQYGPYSAGGMVAMPKVLADGGALYEELKKGALLRPVWLHFVLPYVKSLNSAA